MGIPVRVLPAGGTWKPTDDQLLLLRAALWQGDAAIDAFQTWSARVDVKHLDEGSRRLLPLLFLNLKSLQLPYAQMDYLRAIFQAYWSRSQLTLFRGARALPILAAAGIPTLVLKASALIPLYYKHPGARPLNDFDVLVPTARGRDALELLEREGWTPQTRPREKYKDEFLERTYAHTMQDGKGCQLDLHRHISFLVTDANGDEPFWNGSIPLTVEGTPTRALNPADQLLHVCMHGMPWSPIPPVRWVADAMVILRSAAIDWQRVLEQAARHDLVLAIRHALTFLSEEMNGPIPQDTLRALNALPVSRRAQRDYDLLVTPPWQHNTAMKLWYHYEQYRRLSPVYRREPLLLRFPAFLRDTWELPETSDVPRYMMQYLKSWSSRRLSPRNQMTKDQG